MSDTKIIIQQMQEKVQASLDSFKQDLSKIRTGRASPALLDHVHIDYYGTATQLSQVANITVLDSKTLSVTPWERSMVGAIEKAIRESDLGLNPSGMGELVRVPLPPLNEERRKELVKVVKNEAEKAKVVMRNVRRDANERSKKLLKDKSISEDDERRAQDEVQKMTDKAIVDIDKILQEKEKEILTI